MSTQITTAFVQQYNSILLDLAEQKSSRLRNTVYTKTGVVGKTTYIDQLGSTQAVVRTSRHGDTPLISIPHSRRKIDLKDFEHADLIDKADEIRLLIDPASGYARKQASAFGRAFDEEIITAALGTAYTGETGSSSVTFPAGNQVAVNAWNYETGSGNAGLTVSKIIEARVKLRTADVDPMEEFYFVTTSKGMGQLLSNTKATSSDYVGVKALVSGQLDTFYGFKFIETELLPLDGSGYSRNLAYTKSGIGLAIGKDMSTRIDERADKSYSKQVYTSMTIGASRLEEAKVIEIKCTV